MVIIQDAVDSDVEEVESLLAIASPAIRKIVDTSFNTGSGDYILSPCHTNLPPMLVVAAIGHNTNKFKSAYTWMMLMLSEIYYVDFSLVIDSMRLGNHE